MSTTQQSDAIVAHNSADPAQIAKPGPVDREKAGNSPDPCTKSRIEPAQGASLVAQPTPGPGDPPVKTDTDIRPPTLAQTAGPAAAVAAAPNEYPQRPLESEASRKIQNKDRDIASKADSAAAAPATEEPRHAAGKTAEPRESTDANAPVWTAKPASSRPLSAIAERRPPPAGVEASKIDRPATGAGIRADGGVRIDGAASMANNGPLHSALAPISAASPWTQVMNRSSPATTPTSGPSPHTSSSQNVDAIAERPISPSLSPSPSSALHTEDPASREPDSDTEGPNRPVSADARGPASNLAPVHAALANQDAAHRTSSHFFAPQTPSSPQSKQAPQSPEVSPPATQTSTPAHGSPKKMDQTIHSVHETVHQAGERAAEPAKPGAASVPTPASTSSGSSSAPPSASEPTHVSQSPQIQTNVAQTPIQTSHSQSPIQISQSQSPLAHSQSPSQPSSQPSNALLAHSMPVSAPLAQSQPMHPGQRRVQHTPPSASASPAPPQVPAPTPPIVPAASTMPAQTPLANAAPPSAQPLVDPNNSLMGPVFGWPYGTYPGYNQTGYNQTGYNQTGYNQTGYSQTGYNQTGYSQMVSPGIVPSAGLTSPPHNWYQGSPMHMMSAVPGAQGMMPSMSPGIPPTPTMPTPNSLGQQPGGAMPMPLPQASNAAQMPSESKALPGQQQSSSAGMSSGMSSGMSAGMSAGSPAGSPAGMYAPQIMPPGMSMYIPPGIPQIMTPTMAETPAPAPPGNFGPTNASHALGTRIESPAPGRSPSQPSSQPPTTQLPNTQPPSTQPPSTQANTQASTQQQNMHQFAVTSPSGANGHHRKPKTDAKDLASSSPGFGQSGDKSVKQEVLSASDGDRTREASMTSTDSETKSEQGRRSSGNSTSSKDASSSGGGETFAKTERQGFSRRFRFGDDASLSSGPTGMSPPGLMPPPGVRPNGEMPPPPPSLTNPTPSSSKSYTPSSPPSRSEGRGYREFREANARASGTVGSTRRTRSSEANPTKPPKSPRSKRYWSDQQAALVSSLESRGFAAIFKETAEYSRFFCSSCGKDFETKSLCIRHAVEHLNFKPFRCTDCEMEFTRCDTSQRHLKGRCLGPETQVVFPEDAANRANTSTPNEDMMRSQSQRVGNKRYRPRIDKTRADSFHPDGTPIDNMSGVFGVSDRQGRDKSQASMATEGIKRRKSTSFEKASSGAVAQPSQQQTQQTEQQEQKEEQKENHVDVQNVKAQNVEAQKSGFVESALSALAGASAVQDRTLIPAAENAAFVKRTSGDETEPAKNIKTEIDTNGPAPELASCSSAAKSLEMQRQGPAPVVMPAAAQRPAGLDDVQVSPRSTVRA